VCSLPNNRPARTPSSARLPVPRLHLAGERAAAVIYTAASFVVALAFWLVTTLTGSYTHVARWGGAAWIFLLMMIVLMPIVIPWMKRRERAEEPAACPLPEPRQES
jgi:hypothetical protein